MRLPLVLVASALLVVTGPAFALDISIGDTTVSVGGGDGGGVSASVSSGDTSVGASVGGGGGVSASVSSGGAGAGVNVGGGGGSLLSTTGTAGGTTLNGLVTTNGGSLLTTDTDTSDGTAGATVSLGEALAALFGGEGGDLGALLVGVDPETALLTPGPRGSAAEQLRSTFNRFPFARKKAVRLTCRDVFRNPAAYDLNVRTLCKLIARI